MKKFPAFAPALAVGVLMALSASALACTTIQDGTLETSEGTIIEPGYND